MPVKRLSPPPTASPPRRATISRRVSAGGGTRASTIREGPDDLLGDVDAAAREHGLLDDEVELLLLRDLVDHAGGALLHAGELLVAAQVQVLADLALAA